MQTLAPDSSIGKYVVRRLIATGGMGEVYLCNARGPQGFQKEVVIKRIRSFYGEDPDFIKMFIAEARLASLLNHPNIVQIFDFDQFDDAYFLAMEYVAGHSLQDVQKRRREMLVPMAPVLIAHIGADVARGLHYAHTKTNNGEPLHLVHRDCTPHNVLLSFDGAVKLTDFGVAKASNKSTAPGSLKGKYGYMSPEQARGEDVDARTDVFALGIVLWELLAGSRLFDGDSDVSILRAVQQRVIADPSRIHPDVPAELGAIVMKALARDLDSRYQTAKEFGWDLGRFAEARTESDSARDVGTFLRSLYPDEAHAWGAGKTDEPIPSPSGYEVLPSVAAPGLTPDEDPNAKTVPRVAPREPVNGDPTGTPLQRSMFSPAGAPPPSELTRPERAPLISSAPSPKGSRARLRYGAAAASVALIAIGVVAFRSGRRQPASPPAALETVVTSPERSPNQKPADMVVAPVPQPSDPTSQTPPVEIVTKTESVPATSDSEKREASPTPLSGFLLIRVRPWADVTIDGKEYGLVVKSKKFRLRSGPHRLHLENGEVKEGIVRVEAGKTVEQSYDFK